jgi:glucose/arabinose dehydrogenase
MHLRLPAPGASVGKSLSLYLFALPILAFALIFGIPAPAQAGGLAAEWVVGGLDYPVYVTSPPTDDRLFIVEQRGVIKIFKDGALLPTPFLDIEALVFPPTLPEERGLLGLAFHPDFASNRYFYVKYNDLDWNTVIARYRVSSNPDQADPSTRREIMYIEQPAPNHKGGTLLFGPDGYLYIGMGDGGNAGDPSNYAQRDDTLLGKMLRIDVDHRMHGFFYAIPPDNPYAGPGLPLDEIWAKGFRNPYRWSFDRGTGDLYIGDVGQGLWEEIDYQPATSSGGENYGWRLMEGNHCYDPPKGCNPDTLVLPIHEYQHIFHCAVVGGYVYRGNAIPGLQGTYFFADYCTANIWSFRYDGEQLTEFTDRTDELSPKGEIELISAFGEDADGELYIVERGVGQGEIYRIVEDSGSGIEPSEEAVSPSGFRIFPATPNPFWGSTRVPVLIGWSPRTIGAGVYSASGHLVEELKLTPSGPGGFTVEWDGRDSRGANCASGTYFLRVEADGVTANRRLVLIR